MGGFCPHHSGLGRVGTLRVRQGLSCLESISISAPSAESMPGYGSASQLNFFLCEVSLSLQTAANPGLSPGSSSCFCRDLQVFKFPVLIPSQARVLCHITNLQQRRDSVFSSTRQCECGNTVCGTDKLTTHGRLLERVSVSQMFHGSHVQYKPLREGFTPLASNYSMGDADWFFTWTC